ncbi:MAG TPA: PIN domain-containing protein [Planctomycetota bacterium]|jgi:hypothetical protein
MNGDQFFLDTFFAAALLNGRDRHHEQALAWLPRARRARRLLTTECVLIEIANTLSAIDRTAAAEYIWNLRRSSNVQLAESKTSLIDRGLALYEARRDKEWGLTDCISFVVMEDEGLKDALTGDRHFEQAGFRALLLEQPPTA